MYSVRRCDYRRKVARLVLESVLFLLGLEAFPPWFVWRERLGWLEVVVERSLQMISESGDFPFGSNLFISFCVYRSVCMRVSALLSVSTFVVVLMLMSVLACSIVGFVPTSLWLFGFVLLFVCLGLSLFIYPNDKS